MSNTSYQAQNPDSIRHLFSSIAARYDLGNAMLSGRLHRRWNRYLVERTLLPKPPREYLDLCTGTGDIAQVAVKLLPKDLPYRTMMYLIDFCPEMLQNAEKKFCEAAADRMDFQFTVADAQDLPLPDQSLDCITIAYGIRNIADPYLCLKECYRVLRPGGRIGILELTRPEHPLLKWGHGFYLRRFVPLMGRLLTANKEAYSYLQQSIQYFIAPHTLASMMGSAGFCSVEVESLTGGIASLLTAQKPLKLPK